MTKLIDGKAVRQQLLEGLTGKSTTKNLTIVEVGNDRIATKFIEQKMRTAMQLMIPMALQKVLDGITPLAAVSLMEKLAHDPSVGGIMVQLPVPDQIYEPLLNSLPHTKDVDVIGFEARKDFTNSRSKLSPPAVEVVTEILARQKFNLTNKNVVVVGAGYLVGQPIYTYFKNLNAGVTLIDQQDDPNQLISADLIITGVGKAGLINPAELKEGAAVIDFGNEVVDGQLRGDLDVTDAAALAKLSWYTPTPGGTGPILVAKIFTNFWKLV